MFTIDAPEPASRVIVNVAYRLRLVPVRLPA
jgi:hypothetical protein